MRFETEAGGLSCDGHGRLAALRRLDRRARVAAVDQHGGEDRPGQREERADQERVAEPVVQRDERVDAGRVVGRRVGDRGEDRQAERAADLLARVDQARR